VVSSWEGSLYIEDDYLKGQPLFEATVVRIPQQARTLILLKTWRYISRLLTYLLTYRHPGYECGTVCVTLSS